MTRFSSREVAILAFLVAVLAGYFVTSSYYLGRVIRGLDATLFSGVVFVPLAALSKRRGVLSVAGLVAGLIIEFAARPALPAALYILPSVLGYAVVFDLYFSFVGFENVSNWRQVMIGALLGSTAMSLLALSVLTLAGVIPSRLFAATWATYLIAEIVLGVAGARIGLLIVRKLPPAVQ